MNLMLYMINKISMSINITKCTKLAAISLVRNNRMRQIIPELDNVETTYINES